MVGLSGVAVPAATHESETLNRWSRATACEGSRTDAENLHSKDPSYGSDRAVRGSATLSAAAQTAEETVTFMLFGIDQELVSKHKWSFKIQDRIIILEVKRNTNCNYLLSIEGVDPKTGAYRNDMEIDFSNLSTYDVRAPDHDLATQGARSLVLLWGRNLYNERVFQAKTGRMIEERKSQENVAFFGHASPERHQRAFTYFQTTFCKGRAF